MVSPSFSTTRLADDCPQSHFSARAMDPRGRSPALTCGSRGNRTLSTEVILVVKALKRDAASGNEPSIVSSDVARLMKADLLAVLAELQRQNQWRLTLKASAPTAGSRGTGTTSPSTPR